MQSCGTNLACKGRWSPPPMGPSLSLVYSLLSHEKLANNPTCDTAISFKQAFLLYFHVWVSHHTPIGHCLLILACESSLSLAPALTNFLSLYKLLPSSKDSSPDLSYQHTSFLPALESWSLLHSYSSPFPLSWKEHGVHLVTVLLPGPWNFPAKHTTFRAHKWVIYILGKQKRGLDNV